MLTATVPNPRNTRNRIVLWPVSNRLMICSWVFRRNMRNFIEGGPAHIHWLRETQRACQETIDACEAEIARVTP